MDLRKANKLTLIWYQTLQAEEGVPALYCSLFYILKGMHCDIKMLGWCCFSTEHNPYICINTAQDVLLQIIHFTVKSTKQAKMHDLFKTASKSCHWMQDVNLKEV